MSTPPFRALNILQNPPQSPSAKYQCPVCEQETFPIMLINSIVPVKYAIGKEVGQITALRTISGCGNCRSVISIQFIPVDVPVPIVGQPGEPA
jgi:hypothetical protein